MQVQVPVQVWVGNTVGTGVGTYTGTDIGRGTGTGTGIHTIISDQQVGLELTRVGVLAEGLAAWPGHMYTAPFAAVTASTYLGL